MYLNWLHFFWQMQTDLSPPCQDFRFLASCSNGTLSKLHSSPNQHFHNMVSSWQLKALWPAHSKKHHFCPSVRSLPVLNCFHDCRCGGESHRYWSERRTNCGQRKRARAHSGMTKKSGTHFQEFLAAINTHSFFIAIVTPAGFTESYALRCVAVVCHSYGQWGSFFLLYLLDTWLRRGAQLSADQHMVITISSVVSR